MKKLLLTLSMLAVVGTANAQWHHHGGYYNGGYYNGGNWVAPLIIGGIAGAVIARESQPVIVQQPQSVIVQQPQSVIIQRQPVCTEWKEIQQPDGQIYRERTCTQ
jgi:hypothetical protein